MKHIAKGLTLAELVIAIAVTSIIALATTGVAVALSSAQASADDYGQSVQSARIALRNVGRNLKASVLITGSDSRRLVLWTGDTNLNGKINYDELAVISYDPNSKQLSLYRIAFPSDWPQWLKNLVNSEFDLSETSNPQVVESLLQNSWYSRTTVLATDVSACSLATSPAAPLTKLATVDLTIGQDKSALTASCAAKLRADYTSHVVQAAGEYYLDTQ